MGMKESLLKALLSQCNSAAIIRLTRSIPTIIFIGGRINLKAVLELSEEDINTIINEHFTARGYDAEVKCVGKNVKYEVTIEQWDMEKFE